MAKKFHPEMHEDVIASEPHPPGTCYRVSIGLEDWDQEAYVPVIKVQMSYNGQIAGRKPPSYPLGTDDYARVSKAIEDLVQRRYQNVVAERKTLYTSNQMDG